MGFATWLTQQRSGVRLLNIEFTDFDVNARMLPDGRIVSQRRDRIIDIWKDGRITHSLQGHTERVTQLVFYYQTTGSPQLRKIKQYAYLTSQLKGVYWFL
jgi:hypothetical protein